MKSPFIVMGYIQPQQTSVYDYESWAHDKPYWYPQHEAATLEEARSWVANKSWRSDGKSYIKGPDGTKYNLSLRGSRIMTPEQNKAEADAWRCVHKATGTVQIRETPPDDLPFNRARWEWTPLFAHPSSRDDVLEEAARIADRVAAAFPQRAEISRLQADLAELRQELEAEQRKSEALRREAECHSMEARGANSTIYEAYQICTGATGEPGTWHGAIPIKEAIETLRARATAAEKKLEAAERDAIERCLAKMRPWKRRDHLSLHAGEVTAQEFRTVVAVLKGIEGEFRALSGQTEKQGGEADG